MSSEHSQPTTGADYDQVYMWGRPAATYLAPRQIVRLMILRSRLDDRHLLRNRAPTSDAAD
jgi:hypothetical protein